MAKLPPARIIEETAGNFHPPFYYLILHAWMKLSGDSEFSTRLLSVLFGTVSIFMIYQVGTLLFDRYTGILSAFILASTKLHLYYSREARMYSLLAFLTLLSMYYFIRLFRERRVSVSIGYIISSFCLIYTQNFGLVIILTQNIYFLISLFLERDDRILPIKRWLKLEGVLVVLYLPWLRILIAQTHGMDSSIWKVAKPTAVTLGDTFRQFCGSGPLLALFIVLLVPAVLIFNKLRGGIDWTKLARSIGTYRWSFYFSNFNGICFLITWLVIPVLMTYLYSRYVMSIFLSKVLMSASFPLYIMVGKGISDISRRYLRYAVIVLVCLFSLLTVNDYYTRTYKDQWRTAVDYIASHAESGDLLIVDPGSCLVNVFNYYYKNNNLAERHIETLGLDDPDELVAMKKEIPKRVWIILAHEGIWRKDIERMKKILGGDYYLSSHQEYSNHRNALFTEYRVGLEVYLFQKKIDANMFNGEKLRAFIDSLEEEKGCNLIEDHGFEEQSDRWDWKKEWLSGDVFHSGRYSMNIDRREIPQTNFFLLRQCLALHSGNDYVFGAFVKTRHLENGVSVEVKEVDDTVPHPYQSTNTLRGDNDWTLLMGIFNPRSDAQEGEIEIEIRAGRVTDFQEGEFWVDDVFLVPASRFPGD